MTDYKEAAELLMVELGEMGLLDKVTDIYREWVAATLPQNWWEYGGDLSEARRNIYTACIDLLNDPVRWKPYYDALRGLLVNARGIQ